MTPKTLFKEIITNTRKNTTEQIKFLMDSGFNYVFPTKHSIPKELKDHPNAKSILDNLDGLSNGVIWSDVLLIKSLDKHFTELKHIKSQKDATALQMILVTHRHIGRLDKINTRLGETSKSIAVDLSNFGFFERMVKYKKYKSLKERHGRLTMRIWHNIQFAKQLSTNVAEMEQIAKID